MDANIGNGAARLLLGDCLERLREMEDNSVDSVVTDPPYHLTTGKKGGTGEASVNLESPYGRARISTGFMGMTWDGGDIAFRVELWSECMRVLKPGGHLLAFSGSRTYHRMACAIEDAGFEIRDQIMWVYGSGFPKSMNIAKKLEKIPVEDSPEWVECLNDRDKWLDQYRGLGTALKPAHEPICMARKPLSEKTVAANVLQHGTGAVNVDGCRVATDGAPRANGGLSGVHDESDVLGNGGLKKRVDRPDDSLGRWPANLIHDGSAEVVALFPDSNGAGGSVPNVKVIGYGSGIGTGESEYIGGERTKVDSGSGSAARFFKQCGYDDEDIEAARLFYCAKASRRDRNEGLEDPGPQFEHGTTLRKVENTATKGNNHPTVKPTDLMRYLVRLVTQPGGLVLDPFAGSGSTGKAAMLEGFRFIGCELGAEYLAIASARIEHAHGAANPEPVAAAPEPQLSLFA